MVPSVPNYDLEPMGMGGLLRQKRLQQSPSPSMRIPGTYPNASSILSSNADSPGMARGQSKLQLPSLNLQISAMNLHN